MTKKNKNQINNKNIYLNHKLFKNKLTKSFLLRYKNKNNSYPMKKINLHYSILTINQMKILTFKATNPFHKLNSNNLKYINKKILN